MTKIKGKNLSYSITMLNCMQEEEQEEELISRCRGREKYIEKVFGIIFFLFSSLLSKKLFRN
jgi:hypothetical protein